MRVYDTLVSNVNFPSRENEAVAPLNHLDRISALCDQRLAIGHFVLSLPEDVRLSPEAFDILGLQPRSGPLGLAAFIAAFEGGDAPIFGDLLRRSLIDRQGFQATLRVRWLDESVRLVEVVGDVVIENNRRVAVVGLVRDVTSRAAMMADTSELERMRGIIEAMPTPALLTDHDMRVLACSDMWAKSHGVSAHLALGQDLLKAVHRAPVGWSLEHSKVLDGKTLSTERTFHNPLTGRPAKCMCALMPWVTSDGMIRGVITVIGWFEFAYASKDIAAFVKTQRLRA